MSAPDPRGHRQLVREHVLSDGIVENLILGVLHSRKERDGLTQHLYRARESGQPHGHVLPRLASLHDEHDRAVDTLTQHLSRRIDFLLEHHAEAFKPRHV